MSALHPENRSSMLVVRVEDLADPVAQAVVGKGAAGSVAAEQVQCHPLDPRLVKYGVGIEPLEEALGSEESNQRSRRRAAQGVDHHRFSSPAKLLDGYEQGSTAPA